jgi:hypothetical protein
MSDRNSDRNLQPSKAESNENFINSCINGNLGPFLFHFQYLTNVRKYSPRMVNALLSGSFTPSVALSARDSK